MKSIPFLAILICLMVGQAGCQSYVRGPFMLNSRQPFCLIDVDKHGRVTVDDEWVQLPIYDGLPSWGVKLVDIQSVPSSWLPRGCPNDGLLVTQILSTSKLARQGIRQFCVITEVDDIAVNRLGTELDSEAEESERLRDVQRLLFGRLSAKIKFWDPVAREFRTIIGISCNGIGAGHHIGIIGVCDITFRGDISYRSLGPFSMFFSTRRFLTYTLPTEEGLQKLSSDLSSDIKEKLEITSTHDEKELNWPVEMARVEKIAVTPEKLSKLAQNYKARWSTQYPVGLKRFSAAIKQRIECVEEAYHKILKAERKTIQQVDDFYVLFDLFGYSTTKDYEANTKTTKVTLFGIDIELDNEADDESNS